MRKFRKEMIVFGTESTRNSNEGCIDSSKNVISREISEFEIILTQINQTESSLVALT